MSQSLSSFARQFLGQMPKPDVDLIAGLSPAISISQKSSGTNPRSTVGTITEIYDYLRVLFARVGKGHCPQCHRPITAQTREQIIDRIGVAAAGTRFSDAGAAGTRSKRRVPRPVRGPAETGLRPRPGRWPRCPADRRPAVGPADAAQHRGRRRPPGGRPDDSPAIGRGGRNWPCGWGRGTWSSRWRKEEKEGGRRKGVRNRKRRHDKIFIRIRSFILHPTSDLALSAHYACTHCQKSFEPPSPQLFSFNSPQGMCPECSGLGQIYSFDPQRLIPDPSRSFQQGCIELVGKWREMGRWKRHIFRGVAETLERKHGLPPGTVLETAWEELDERVRQALLWGTGDEHITFTWRSGPSGYKWGGPFEGIIPKLSAQYRNTRSRPQRRQLEKYMRVLGCGRCHGPRLNAQACAVTLTTAARLPDARSERSLPEVCQLAINDATEFFSALELDATGATIAAEALKEVQAAAISQTWGFEYLTLDRTAPTLSGGEMQRIRLAADRLRAGGRALYPRRTVHRPARPRQRQAAGNARPASRPGQHGSGRRARRRHHAGSRPHCRFRPGAGRSRGPRGGGRDAIAEVIAAEEASRGPIFPAGWIEVPVPPQLP